jgi:hypothetical protein
MQLKRLTRKQIREQIEATPVEEILHVPVRSLTTKQKAYCKQVAQGKPKSKAYRDAYQSKAKPSTIGTEVQRMTNNPRIALEVEAQKRAIEFETAYSAKQLKSIVISQLTLEALNPESKPSERISALKALGNVAELGVFVERKEIRTIKDSATAKAELMDKLRQAIKDQSRTIDGDAMSLLDEINNNVAPQQEDIGGQALAATPPTPTPQIMAADHAPILHTIPANRSPEVIENDSQNKGG